MVPAIEVKPAPVRVRDEPPTEPRPPLHLGRRLTGIGLGVAALAAFQVLNRFPTLAESLVGQGPLPGVVRGLSRLTGTIPVSLAEVVVLAVVVRQGVGLARGLRQLHAGADSFPRTTARGGLRLAQDLGVLVFLFYLLWGFQYARPGVEARLEIPPAGEVSAAELRSLASDAVHAGNRLYRALHGVEDAGEPTPHVQARAVIPALEEGWERATERWGLEPRMALRHGTPKTFAASPLVKRFGVAGMYFPYTGEALVLSDLPGALRGKELAHEMAHQRGVARESDANTLAYLVTREAPDPRVRYAGSLFLQRQLISALGRIDPDGAWAVSQERLPGVRRDLEAVVAYWADARGPVSDATTRLNHAMLRSHGIAEGVENYRGSVWAFVALARREGVPAILTDPVSPGVGAGGPP